VTSHHTAITQNKTITGNPNFREADLPGFTAVFTGGDIPWLSLVGDLIALGLRDDEKTVYPVPKICRIYEMIKYACGVVSENMKMQRI
jgi:hypothetical protein